MSFLNALADKIGEIERRAQNLPQELDSALLSLDKDNLAKTFSRLAQDHFILEQQRIPNSKVVMGNEKVEVKDVRAGQAPSLQTQGYIVLEWNQYQKLLRELAELLSGKEAEEGNVSEADALDLQLEAEETRPQGLSPSIQLELKKMDHELQIGLRELSEGRAKRDKEWQETLERWDEERRLRNLRFRGKT